MIAVMGRSEGLRWSFDDWACAKEGEEHFETLNEQQAEATKFDDWDDDTVENQVAKLMNAVVAGLVDLEREGFFRNGIGMSVVAAITRNSAAPDHLSDVSSNRLVSILVFNPDGMTERRKLSLARTEPRLVLPLPHRAYRERQLQFLV